MVLNDAQLFFKQALANEQVNHYGKTGIYDARQVTEITKVITTIKGEEETINIAEPEDWIVTGVSGEQYVLKPTAFIQRYRKLASGQFQAIGDCYAVEYTGSTFYFDAPWGASMVCNRGDFIASTTKDNLKDVYRIAGDVFYASYQPLD